MYLSDITDMRKLQLAKEKERISPEEMVSIATSSKYPSAGFKKALMSPRLAVIAEVKKSSPSKGLICPDFDPVKIAKAYEDCGADAISCLTEEHFFGGASQYLRQIKEAVKIPVLRKDFIIDEYQIYEARAIGADAILLIAAILSDNELRRYNDTARSLGLDVLAEAHSEDEVKRLVNAGFDIIGINNRDLKTFEVKLETTMRLARLIPDDTIIVCESGIKNNRDMKYARECKADAVLIGETLMRSSIRELPECISSLRENV